MRTQSICSFVFREYDIRGRVDDDFPMSEIYNLIRAIAYHFRMKNSALKTIAVGMDGRTHSLAIRELVCKGLTDSGLDALVLGLCPSPALYFALHTTRADGGIMITASHNPPTDNGIKSARLSRAGQSIRAG
jgi:phosphomannomutase